MQYTQTSLKDTARELTPFDVSASHFPIFSTNRYEMAIPFGN
jgi:hypothetical protein